jgi:hypothetical protein
MKMREKILMGAVLLLVLAMGGNWVFEKTMQGPISDRRKTIERLNSELEKKEDDYRRALQASEKLDRWNEQSLPAADTFAGSLYQEWLQEEVSRTGFKEPRIDSSEPVSLKGVYWRYGYTLRCQGTLEQLTRFLYDFYRADFLHQIPKIAVKPMPRSGNLDLTFTIEALALADAEQNEQLNNRVSDRLASEFLADYQAVIDRDLFGIRGTSGFDPADHAFLTAIIDVDGQPQAWFTLRSSDQILKLNKGASLEVGQFFGVVVEIEDQDVIIDSDGERWLLSLGDSLTRAAALPPEF